MNSLEPPKGHTQGFLAATASLPAISQQQIAFWLVLRFKQPNILFHSSHFILPENKNNHNMPGAFSMKCRSIFSAFQTQTQCKHVGRCACLCPLKPNPQCCPENANWNLRVEKLLETPRGYTGRPPDLSQSPCCPQWDRWRHDYVCNKVQ